MAGDRELPPLRVSLRGAPDSFHKMIQDAEKALDGLDKKAKEVGQGGKAPASVNKAQKMTAMQAERLANMQDAEHRRRQDHNAKMEAKESDQWRKKRASAEALYQSEINHLNKVAAHKARQRRLDEAHNQKLTAQQIKAIADSQARQAKTRQAAQKHMAAMAASHQRSAQSAAKHTAALAATQQKAANAAATHQQRMQQSAQHHQQKMSAGQQRMQRSASTHQRQMQQSAQKHQQSMSRSQQQARQSAQRHQQGMQQSAQRHLMGLASRSATMLRQNARAQQVTQQSAQRHQQSMAAQQQRMQQSAAAHQARMARTSQQQRSSGRGSSGFSALGDRADIYMHANAIKQVTQLSSSFIAASADWQRMSVQLEGFTGSAEKAASVMNDMQKAALESPYDMQTLMDSTKTMMAYGAEVDIASDITKQLGEVAGGSNDKLNRLSLGMAQIISMGRLQGNELRQLTEHGFNPLRTIAERTLRPMQSLEDRMRELNKAKENGLITSKMVVAALDTETAAGGRFAGMSQRMANDVWGLAQQIQELTVLLKKRFMDTLLNDIKAQLRYIRDLTQAWADWAEKAENQEQVRSIAMIAKNAVVAVVVVNLLGGALAVVRWQLAMVGKVVGVVTMAFRGMAIAVTLVRKAIMLAMLANPIGLKISAILALIAAVSSLVAIITYPGGLTGAWGDMMAAGKKAFVFLNGFMANFGDNIQILGKWIAENWGKAIVGMLRLSMRLFMVFGTWLVTYLPKQMWIVGAKMMTNLFKAVSKGLSKVGEAIKFLWDNMYDPGKVMAYFAKFAGGIAQDQSITANEGLIAGATHVLKDELSAMNFPQLKLGISEPVAPENFVPEERAAKEHDWDSMMGVGDKTTDGTKTPDPVQAMLAGSSEHALQVWRQTRDAQGATAVQDPVLVKQQKQVDLLTLIEQNTRPDTGNGLVVASADLTSNVPMR